MLDALRRTLHAQSDDWAMTFVRQPEAAWEALLETAYDAVVTDLSMPGISGLDLLERIRQSDKTQTRARRGVDRAERPRPERKGPRTRGRRSAEQTGRRRAVDRPAAERPADEDLPGQLAGDERVAGREGPAAERRLGPIADERRLPVGHGGRVPRRGHGKPRRFGWAATAGPLPRRWGCRDRFWKCCCWRPRCTTSARSAFPTACC